MSIKQSLLHARINQLHKRLKHKLGMHDQREHGNWSKGPGMYGGEVYVPTGRRAEFLANRLNAPMNTLATIAQEETLFNITKRLPPKAKTGVPSQFAPMPIDTSEFEPGGFIYEQLTNGEDESFIGWIIDNGKKFKNLFTATRNTSLITPVFRDIFSEFYLENISDDEISNFVDFFRDMNAPKIVPEQIKDAFENIRSMLNESEEYQNYKKQYIEIEKEQNKITQNAQNEIEQYFTTPEFTSEVKIPLSSMNSILANMSRMSSFQDALSMSSLTKMIVESEIKSNNPELSNVEIYMILNRLLPYAQQYDEILNRKDTINTPNDIYQAINKFMYSLNRNTAYIHHSFDLNQTTTNVVNNSEDFYDMMNDIDSSIKFNKPLLSLKFMSLFNNFKNHYLYSPQDLNIDNPDFYKEINNGIEQIKNDIQEKINLLNKHKNIFDDVSTTIDVLEKKLSLLEDIEISHYQKDISKFDENTSKKSKKIVKNIIYSKFEASRKETIQEVLGMIYDAQSYNGKPEIVDWNNIINPTTPVQTDTQGMPLVFFRSNKGISDTDPEQIDRGMEYVEQMRTGDVHYPGTGVSGYGTYMKTSNIYGLNRAEGRVSGSLSEYSKDPNEQKQVQIAKTTHQESLYKIADDLQKLLPNLDLENSPEIKNVIDTYINGVETVKDIIANPGLGMETYSSAINEAFGNYNSDAYQSEKTTKIVNKAISNNKIPINQNTNQLIDLFNQIANLNLPVEDDFFINRFELYPVYDRVETLASDANATREMYGEYTTAYTVNSDARMPPGFVNGSNHGNMHHMPIISLDQYINREFSSRYPMLPTNVNIGIKMAILGYDAYYPHLNDHSTNVVVLNRAILNVANSTLTGDESSEDVRNFINKFVQQG